MTRSITEILQKKKLNKTRILLGITGGIAAYKAAALVRLFVKSGAEVKIVATKDALSFVTPLTLSTLSKNPVYSEFVDPHSDMWTNHVELGKWADLMLIAPCTAHSLAKMANGLCDNLLLASYLSADCPVFFAPAMDLDMYAHPSTGRNIETLKRYGNFEIEAEYGELASGLKGKGRMAEPENILERIEDFIQKKKSLSNKTILVNAGPTFEAIDPVRFIGNHSSGKMGIAIANELFIRGANVKLVLGPSPLRPVAGVEVSLVQSALEMKVECERLFENADAAILAAAVADYRPASAADQKIKKTEDSLSIKLVKNPDILESLGKKKNAKQVLVGFALETENEYDNALTKLKKKNLDFIVLNSLRDPEAGFGKDSNKITVIEANSKNHTFESKSKEEVARDIIELLFKYL